MTQDRDPREVTALAFEAFDTALNDQARLAMNARQMETARTLRIAARSAGQVAEKLRDQMEEAP